MNLMYIGMPISHFMAIFIIVIDASLSIIVRCDDDEAISYKDVKQNVPSFDAANPNARPSSYDDLEQSIRSTMNAAMDPCDDFYEYACGGWLASNQGLNASKNKVSRSFTATADSNQVVLANLIQSNKTDPRTRLLFNSCSNKEAIEDHDLDSAIISELLAQIDSIDSIDDVVRTGGRFVQVDVPFFFLLDVTGNKAVPSSHIVSISSAGLVLKDSTIYVNASNPNLIAYRAHIEQILEILGDEDATTTSQEIVRLERRIRKAKQIPKAELRPENLETTETIMDLPTLTMLTGLDWVAVFDFCRYRYSIISSGRC